MTVHLITSSSGFPNGTAAANRIKMIGLSLTEVGCQFKVYSNSVEYNKLNCTPNGLWNEIKYTYLHGQIKLNTSKIKKLLIYFKGVIRLNKVLQSLNSKDDIIYLYAQSEMFNLYTVLFCKLYKLKVVQEINEWHSELQFSYERFIRNYIMVRYSDGAIVISKEIDNKVKERNKNIKTITVPVLQSPNFNFKKSDKNIKPYCFWMGLINAYIKDVIFIIEGCGVAFSNNIDFDVVLSGPYSMESKNKILETAQRVKFPIENIKFLGYIDEKSLNEHCSNAYFYIIPMWNDQRSQSRFPTKLASFMFVGKPVITAKVGELGQLLTDDDNILFYECADKNSLAKKIVILFKDDILYDSLSQNSKKFALNTFNYKIYGNQLKCFFESFLI
nr:glycosyltransferase [uncultured Emticicia sp.]